ncbi:MAG: hypothetical protein HZA25_00250 [Candidatus Niyogibacteria bacterium]|nr:hypothetical protein [Candidatus Niyogibacteria bacterium]
MAICTSGTTTFSGLVCKVTLILNDIIPILGSLAVAMFIWSVIQYIRAGGDEKKLEEEKWRIIYGLIGLTVIFGLWGLLQLLINTFFGTGSYSIPPGPTI